MNKSIEEKALVCSEKQTGRECESVSACLSLSFSLQAVTRWHSILYANPV